MIPMNEKKNEISCPACGSGSNKEVSEFSFFQDGKGFFSNSYNVLECSECRLWFKNNIPSKETITGYYESLPSDGIDWDYKGRLPHEEKIDRILFDLFPQAKVLDVGCWTGRLLAPHKSIDRFGIEPNELSSKVAEGKGIKILGNIVNEETLLGHMFDAISMVDVFEHLNNPFDVIEVLLKHLTPGGKLIIVTGASDSTPFQLAGISYWYYSLIPDHIVFMNTGFINWLRKKFTGFSIEVERVRHFAFNNKKFIKEMAWLFIWRYLNPNSPFKRNKLQKILSAKKFSDFKEVIICSNQKDHFFVVFTNRSQS